MEECGDMMLSIFGVELCSRTLQTLSTLYETGKTHTADVERKKSTYADSRSTPPVYHSARSHATV
jgi:hypothetical protein